MKTLTKNLHSIIFRMRKVIILILVVLSLSAAFAKKTSSNYGFDAKINFANQLAYNPRNIENESYKWNSLTCLGMDAFLEIQKTKHLTFLGRLWYNQKGFIEKKGTVLPTNNRAASELPNASFLSPKNKFHYLTLDALLKYNFGKRLVVPFLLTGLQLNFLLTKNMKSEELFQRSALQFQDYKSYKSAAIGIIFGAGITIDKKITLAFESNYDLTKSVNTTNLIVKNWVNSISIGVNINELFKK